MKTIETHETKIRRAAQNTTDRKIFAAKVEVITDYILSETATLYVCSYGRNFEDDAIIYGVWCNDLIAGGELAAAIKNGTRLEVIDYEGFERPTVDSFKTQITETIEKFAFQIFNSK